MPQPAFIVNLYDSLINAPDDRTRARIIASAFEDLEERYPALRDLATASGLRETELRLQKEIQQVRADLSIQIEQVRKETQQVRADLSIHIEQVRKETQQVRADLSIQIEQVRKETEQVRTDLTARIEQVRADLIEKIENTRAELRIEIERVRTDLTRAIHETKTELQGTIHKGNMTILRWMVSLLTAQIVAILVAVFTIILK